jgi:hypothetical protein
MTTKHVVDQNVHDTDVPVDDSGTKPDVQAEDASRKLLAKARYDAFRLMTEARDEAETILDEARAEAAGTKKAAEITAETVSEKASVDAAAIVEASREEAAAIVASAHRTAGEQSVAEDSGTLEAEHKALSDRVSTLRTLADQLEDRFAALAATAAAPTPAPASKEMEPQRSAIDYSPSVSPASEPDERTDADVPIEERRSFYSRRSAKLPRLGEEGGKGALDVTRALRESMDTS